MSFGRRFPDRTTLEQEPDRLGAADRLRLHSDEGVQFGELVGLKAHQDGRPRCRGPLPFRGITSCASHMFVIPRVQADGKFAPPHRP